jgi:hypothetical protein
MSVAEHFVAEIVSRFLHRLNLAIANDEEEMLSGVTDAVAICV